MAKKRKSSSARHKSRNRSAVKQLRHLYDLEQAQSTEVLPRPQAGSTKVEPEKKIELSFVKKDLTRTIIVSIILFMILAALYFTQDTWQKFLP